MSEKMDNSELALDNASIKQIQERAAKRQSKKEQELERAKQQAQQRILNPLEYLQEQKRQREQKRKEQARKREQEHRNGEYWQSVVNRGIDSNPKFMPHRNRQNGGKKAPSSEARV